MPSNRSPVMMAGRAGVATRPIPGQIPAMHPNPMNFSILEGVVTGTPETRSVPGGAQMRPVTSFWLLVEDGFPGSPHTSRHVIEAWNALSAQAAEVPDGCTILVEGKLRVRERGTVILANRIRVTSAPAAAAVSRLHDRPNTRVPGVGGL